jgi:hypothetical protein
MADLTDVAGQLNALQTQTTINSVISGAIMILSVIKPILLEYIRRRWTRAENVRRESMMAEEQ